MKKGLEGMMVLRDVVLPEMEKTGKITPYERLLELKCYSYSCFNSVMVHYGVVNNIGDVVGKIPTADEFIKMTREYQNAHRVSRKTTGRKPRVIVIDEPKRVLREYVLPQVSASGRLLSTVEMTALGSYDATAFNQAMMLFGYADGKLNVLKPLPDVFGCVKIVNLFRKKRNNGELDRPNRINVTKGETIIPTAATSVPAPTPAMISPTIDDLDKRLEALRNDYRAVGCIVGAWDIEYPRVKRTFA